MDNILAGRARFLYAIKSTMDKHRRPKILWSIKADDTLQLWPSADSECALTAPFLPAHLVNTPKFPQITAPSHAAAGFLEREGISAAAFSIHSKSYYSERVNKKFSTIMYTISGSARAEFGGNVKILKAGSCFLSAKSANTKLRVNKRWEVLWFHFKDSPLSCAMFGSESKLFESKNFKEILWLAQSYRDKVYSKSLNRRALEALAVLIRESIACNFPPPPKGEIIRRAAEDHVSAKNFAAKNKITVYELNKRSLSCTGQTFARLAKEALMKKARDFLTLGSAPCTVAKKLGYASIQSFSKAFKKEHGLSPSNFARLHREKL